MRQGEKGCGGGKPEKLSIAAVLTVNLDEEVPLVFNGVYHNNCDDRLAGMFAKMKADILSMRSVSFGLAVLGFSSGLRGAILGLTTCQSSFFLFGVFWRPVVRTQIIAGRGTSTTLVAT